MHGWGRAFSVTFVLLVTGTLSFDHLCAPLGSRHGTGGQGDSLSPQGSQAQSASPNAAADIFVHREWCTSTNRTGCGSPEGTSFQERLARLGAGAAAANRGAQHGCYTWDTAEGADMAIAMVPTVQAVVKERHEIMAGMRRSGSSADAGSILPVEYYHAVAVDRVMVRCRRLDAEFGQTKVAISEGATTESQGQRKEGSSQGTADVQGQGTLNRRRDGAYPQHSAAGASGAAADAPQFLASDRRSGIRGSAKLEALLGTLRAAREPLPPDRTTKRRSSMPAPCTSLSMLRPSRERSCKRCARRGATIPLPLGLLYGATLAVTPDAAGGAVYRYEGFQGPHNCRRRQAACPSSMDRSSTPIRTRWNRKRSRKRTIRGSRRRPTEI